jgi:BirA family transcriptional regulator, biotin operon repressor / biotin---[acetyl-CoA-carboxylase] ligase
LAPEEKRGLMARARTAPRTDLRVPLPERLFAALADGKFHSGEDLAQTLRVSRSAVWKAAGTLRALGATLDAVRNRGYRLQHEAEPLQAQKIRRHLAAEVRARVRDLTTVWSTDSTNSALLKRPNPMPGDCEVLLAEHQSAGRGRRGRSWVAPLGGAICLSLSWTFGEAPEDLGALGLVIGVCTLRALRRLGVSDLKLKWPNDLLREGKKLAGVLIELRGESQGPACVVVGIGMNVALGPAVLKQIAQLGIAATDLAGAGLRASARNRIAAALIAECVPGLLTFEREQLKPFIAEWSESDALAGRPVSVAGAGGDSLGIARGIDLHGALLLETHAGIQRVIAGDVTVRPE